MKLKELIDKLPTFGRYRSYAVEFKMLSQRAMFILRSASNVGVCTAIRLAFSLAQVIEVRNF